MTYPISFRRKVLKSKIKEKLSFTGVAAKYGIARSAVCRWSKSLEGKNRRDRKWKKLDKDELKRDIEDNPDSYNHERAKKFGVSTSGIRYAMKCLGVSYKKNSKTSKEGSRKKVYVLPGDKEA